jgi:cyclopropane fatty-acyl-phospholipid synthase-like methyltransferase
VTQTTDYPRAAKYPDLETVYSECSGPGGLKLAEFIASKLDLTPDARLLDIGTNRGFQTCFLAKEYGVSVVGIDPWIDPFDPERLPMVEHVWRNARAWGVEDHVLPVGVGVPKTRFADGSFDAAYSTTALEMIRGLDGEEKYRECLAEVLRVLRPGALFGMGEPMHLDVELPQDLAPLVTKGRAAWADCFATIGETVDAFESVGFDVLESGYAADARAWWDEFSRYSPWCRAHPEEDPRRLEVDDGRWVSVGYVIARRPHTP